MGLTAVTAITAGEALFGAGTSIFSEVEQAKQQKQALDLRLAQEESATNQRKIATTNRLQGVLSSQLAAQAASGFTTSSPSFGAIQVDTLNNAAQDLHAEDLNQQFQQTAIETQKQAINQGRDIGIGENLFNAALSVGAAFATPKTTQPFTQKIASDSSGFNQQIMEAGKQELSPESIFGNNPLFQDPLEIR